MRYSIDMRILPSFFILLVLLLGASFFTYNYFSANSVLPSQEISSLKKQNVKGIEANSKQVKSVIDGDTLSLTTGEKIRLIGINAPESGQPYFDKAKNLIEDLIQGKTVDIEYDTMKEDQYLRTLAYVYLNDIFINKELVRQGLAVVETIPPNVAHTNELVEAQKEAREKCAGIWEGLCKQTGTSCIQISSINAAPKGESTVSKNNEWIEFMNTCFESKNLTGYLLKDSSASNSYQFKNIVMRSKQKIKLHSGCGTDTPADIYWQCPERGSMVWNNSQDHAFLYDNEGRLVSELAY